MPYKPLLIYSIELELDSYNQVHFTPHLVILNHLQPINLSYSNWAGL